MHLSPFSANISLKSSLIKNKSGAQLLPPATLYPCDVKTEHTNTMIATNNKLKEDLSALQNKFEEVLAKYEAAQIEIETLKRNPSNIKHEVKGKKGLKKLRQKARLNAEKVEGITEVGGESPRIGSVECPKSVKHPSPPPSPHTPTGTPPPPGPSQASHRSHLPVIPTFSPPDPDLPACSSPRETSPDTNEAETETVLFEGRLISKQDALQKILEAVQDVNNNFNPK